MKYTKEHPLRVIELFSGIGAQRSALERADIPHKVVAISEIDKFALKSYNEMYNHCLDTGETINLGDITKIDPNDVPDCDFMTYSSPCFVAGTKVLTDTGYKNIEDIQLNDKVMTHKNRFKPVIHLFKKQANQLQDIKAMMSDNILTTPNHPFYARKRYRKWDNTKRCYVRLFEPPKWISAKDLTKDYFLGTPINQNSVIPNWNGIYFTWGDGRATRHANELNNYMSDSNFWWLVGRYMGDGWYRENQGIIICCALDKQQLADITSRLDKLNAHYCIAKERTTYKVSVSRKEWFEFFKSFGNRAHNKHLTKDILDLPVSLLKSFLEGYISSDGHVTPRGKQHEQITISSVSNTLIYDLGQVVAKVYHRPFSIYRTKRPKTCVIENRVVNQRDTYTIRFKKTNNKQDVAFYDGNYVWSPIKSNTQLNKARDVYNLEVLDDNSYTVQNMIVHNCQSFSIAGHMLGGEKNSGTESSLLWEVEKIIRAKKPKYLMLENVKMLVSKKFKHTFDDWLKVLDNLGYNTYWKVLNAKDFGVPQNRERVYAISIRKDIDTKTFEFPKPFKLTKRLKDILEPNVDKRFYLKQELIDRFKFVKQNKSDTVTTSPVGDLNHFAHRHMNCVFGDKSISPTLSTMQGGNTQPKVLIKANNSLGYNEAKDGDSISLDHPNSTKKHSRVTKDVSRTLTTSQDVGVIRLKYVGHIGDKDIVGDGKELSCNIPQGNRVYSSNGIATTQSANGGGIGRQTGLYYVDFSIRKLTPKECWRLMGFSDSQFEKAESVCSNTQLYKQAGNSIVIDVMEYIFKNLFKE